LRNTQGRKLLINTVLKIKLIERGLPELGSIVTVNDFQAVGMLIVQPQSQTPKLLKYLILTFQKESSRVTRIVINDDKDVPLASHGANLTVSIWSNCSGCSVITVLTREWETMIILP
jgi:hypothetical protein